MCPEPEDQSFLVNGPESPVTLNWLAHTDEFGNANWSVNLKTNLHDFAHPCGANHFTWSMFMDHVSHGGGPLPPPDRVRFSATVNYNDFAPNGATRGIALYQGYWAGKARLIEITFQGVNWGDNYPDDPMVFDYRDGPNFTFVGVHGSYFGITVTRLQDTVLAVDWTQVVAALIAKGFLPALDSGAQTHAIGLGHEVHNWQADLAAIADVWFTNFRVSEG